MPSNSNGNAALPVRDRLPAIGVVLSAKGCPSSARRPSLAAHPSQWPSEHDDHQLLSYSGYRYPAVIILGKL